MTEPRLRGGNPLPRGPYPLGQIPNSVLIEVGKQIVHRLAVGMGDVEGNDFGTIFANAVHGEHLSRPLGLADVIWNGCAWSVKTVKQVRPFDATRVRFISGRNSPDYSLGIENPHADPAATGRAVIAIWNSRVNRALEECEDLRNVFLLRNVAAKEFVLFEESTQRFIPDDYSWRFNQRNNLEGTEKVTGVHRLTWQPHGSQFTIFRDIPGSARQFTINRNVPLVDPSTVLAYVDYRDSWIEIQQ